MPRAWYTDNQRYIIAGLAALAEGLRRQLAPAGTASAEPGGDPWSAADAIAEAMAPAPALEQLRHAFGLSPFERDVLLLCAGVEFDGGFAALCGEVQGDARRCYPTFSLALAALPGAHWDALTAAGALRHWRLIELEPGYSLTARPLRISERVLHFLAGVQHIDEQLAGVADAVPAPGELLPSQRDLAARIAAAWSMAGSDTPLVQLCGGDAADKRVVAAAACAALRLELYALPAEALPASPGEIDALARLWRRDALLGGCALLIECDEIEQSDTARVRAVGRMAERAGGALAIACRDRIATSQRAVVLDLHRPAADEQRRCWRIALGPAAERLNGQLDLLVGQFSMGARAIQHASIEALGADDLGQALWDACRRHTRPKLDDLAQRIEAVATWDDLVLPEAQRELLREIALHVRNRTLVYEGWGFGAKSARGLGVAALFAGASGTGKTMAAEVLANELRLDLYRIDLSQVVSKYIGETEKNLRRVFDAAEGCGAILLFDEADALFGKRSEVRDSHDRHANVEVSYLLQRMEAYRGLAILTTNLKDALDSAFLRRIRFVVQFPFPDAAQRAAIWRRAFPAATPTAGLEAEKLARLNVAGGNIRNIALGAAFLAADAGEPVGMAHLLRAARREYAKLERALTDAETKGWITGERGSV